MPDLTPPERECPAGHTGSLPPVADSAYPADARPLPDLTPTDAAAHRCGAVHQLNAPAITGRAIVFECERTPGHLGSHRETVGEFAGVWAHAAEEATP